LDDPRRSQHAMYSRVSDKLAHSIPIVIFIFAGMLILLDSLYLAVLPFDYATRTQRGTFIAIYTNRLYLVNKKLAALMETMAGMIGWFNVWMHLKSSGYENNLSN
jgi:hypothetical protein